MLPFWVADMDLPMAPAVVDAVRERLRHPILGYTATPPAVVEAFVAWLARRYGWVVREEWLVWLTGVVPGFNLAAQTLARPSADLVMFSPAYPPFFKVAERAGIANSISTLARGHDGRWEMDFDDLAARISPHTALVLFCNPHNPTGRVYERAELESLAALVVERDTVLVSDDIHCPLVLDAHRRHIPIASLHDDIAKRSISLFAPTKAYNFPGLGGAVAVVPDARLRERFAAAVKGMASNVSPLAYAALTAAFNDTSWLDDLNAFLAGNGERLERAIAELGALRSAHVEGTYLAWLDVSELGLPDPAAHFEACGLGLSDGVEFGAKGFLRFNFGCPRSLLEQGIARLRAAVQGAPAGAG